MLDYDIVDSPDDGGTYAEIFNAITGETVYVSPVFSTAHSAIEYAEEWISDHS